LVENVIWGRGWLKTSESVMWGRSLKLLKKKNVIRYMNVPKILAKHIGLSLKIDRPKAYEIVMQIKTKCFNIIGLCNKEKAM